MMRRFPLHARSLAAVALSAVALPATLAALSACSGESANGSSAVPAEANAAAAPSAYQSDIAPLLTANCATCHLTGQEAGGMALVPDKALASLVGVKALGAPGLIRVVPGDPDKSYLIMKLEGTHMTHGGTGARMPFGAPQLPPETIAKIRAWVAEGAKP